MGTYEGPFHTLAIQSPESPGDKAGAEEGAAK